MALVRAQAVSRGSGSCVRASNIQVVCFVHALAMSRGRGLRLGAQLLWAPMLELVRFTLLEEGKAGGGAKSSGYHIRCAC